MTGLLLWMGIAGWMLVAAVGLALHARRHSTPEDAAFVILLSWVAGGVLLVAVSAAWYEGLPLPPSLPRLLLMAAVAAPLLPDDGDDDALWRRGLSLLPSPILVGIGMGWLSRLVNAPVTTEAGPTLLSLGMTACGGLGARAIGESLAALVARSQKWPPSLEMSALMAYLPLTLLAGMSATGALIHHGSLAGARIAAAWPAWSAARSLSEERPVWLRASAVGLAGVVLVGVAAFGG